MAPTRRAPIPKRAVRDTLVNAEGDTMVVRRLPKGAKHPKQPTHAEIERMKLLEFQRRRNTI